MEPKHLFGLLVALILITMIFTSSLIVDKTKLTNEVENLEWDVNELEETVDFWKDKYLNDPRIETETEYIYVNTTEYVTEYITEYVWNNQTFYVDNAICDVNRDGVVNYYDTCEVLWYIKNGKTLVEEWFLEKYGNPYDKLYDVNRDGKVNTSDIDFIWEHADFIY